MPPIEWSMIQSVLLTLILPTCAASAGSMAIAAKVFRSEQTRSLFASIAFLVGLTVGLAVQNSRGDLIPFLAIERTIVPESEESHGNQNGPGSQKTYRWTLETGWRSLFSATVVFTLAQIASEYFCRRSPRFVKWAAIALSAAFGAWLATPSEIMSKAVWALGLLVLITLLNKRLLRAACRFPFRFPAPLLAALIWSGSSTMVALLSHSAKFADLAMLNFFALAGAGLVLAIHKIPPTSLLTGPCFFIPALMLSDQQNTFSEIPIASFILIAAAPLSLVFIRIPKVRAWFETRPVALLTLVSIPCFVAVGLAMRAEM